jgi:ribosomal protein S18 acetylase RimI-like enzyme
VAVWLPPPGRSSMSFVRLLHSGLLAESVVLGPREFLRANLLGAHVQTLDMEVYRRSYWYLWLLAVDPARQGRGIGGALLEPVLEGADASGLPCALETMTERNVRFYEKHGFGVVRQAPSPLGGPRCWAMRREPSGTTPGSF